MTIEDDIAFFERVPTLRHARARRRCAFSRSAPRAATCIAARCCSTPASRPTAAIVVQEGTFSLTRARRRGRRQRRRSDAARCSASSRCSPRPCGPVTATAHEPSTVMRIPRTLFLKMLEGYPDAATKLRDIIATRAPTSRRERSTACARLLDGRRYDAGLESLKRPASPSPARGRTAAPSRARPCATLMSATRSAERRRRPRCGRAGGPCRRSAQSGER